MPFGRRSPLETLALPGVILAYKYSQFRQRRREAASRRVTERELSALHHKIVSKTFSCWFFYLEKELMQTKLRNLIFRKVVVKYDLHAQPISYNLVNSKRE